MKNMHYDEFINGLHVDVVDGALTGDFTMITGSLVLLKQMSGPTAADDYVFPDYDADAEEKEEDEKLNYVAEMTNELVAKLNKLFFGDAAADGADDAETEV